MVGERECLVGEAKRLRALAQVGPALRELERRIRDLERLLGRKTMEAEILKEALDVARAKKPTLQLPSWSTAGDGSR